MPTITKKASSPLPDTTAEPAVAPKTSPVPKTKSPKVVAPAPAPTPTPAPAPAPVPVPTPVNAVVDDMVDAVSEVSPVVKMSPLTVLEEKMAALSGAMKDVAMQLRIVKKEYESLNRVAERVEKKRANARTTPNGFAKPTKISDELCAFLNVPAGCEKSRTEVTREIHKYIKANSLFNKDNKRIIVADPVLKKLLSIGDGVEVTYFNLQSFLKHHFIKATPSSQVAV